MKHKYLLLGWVTSDADSNKNFGDELSPFIVKKLSGLEIYNVPIISSRFRLILMILKRIFLFRWTNGELFVFWKLFWNAEYILSLGSILHFYKFSSGIVWGSGLIQRDFSVGDNRYMAVRGPLTREALIKRGLDVPEVYGDPAILLPMIVKAGARKDYELGIVPHKIHYSTSLERKIEDNVLLINLSTADVVKIIHEICSCSFILSSSLHGLIVAHAYGIPALWVNLGPEKLMGDNMKFADYFLSVGIEPYEPFDIESITFSDAKITIGDFFREHQRKSLPLFDLNDMAKGLLKVAPFDIVQEYRY